MTTFNPHHCMIYCVPDLLIKSCYVCWSKILNRVSSAFNHVQSDVIKPWFSRFEFDVNKKKEFTLCMENYWPKVRINEPKKWKKTSTAPNASGVSSLLLCCFRSKGGTALVSARPSVRAVPNSIPSGASHPCFNFFSFLSSLDQL